MAVRERAFRSKGKLVLMADRMAGFTKGRHRGEVAGPAHGEDHWRPYGADEGGIAAPEGVEIGTAFRRRAAGGVKPRADINRTFLDD